MYHKRKILIVFLVLFVLVACSKKEKEAERPQNETKKGKTVVAKTVNGTPGKYITAAFTDNTNWMNGISLKDRSQFLLQIGKKEPIPFDVGYKLKFALSGEVEIVKVSRMEIKGSSNIFINVNKPLDPIGDGNPNPFIPTGFKIVPASANKANVWRNGMSLNQDGMFVFWIRKIDTVPIKVGDTLRFAFTGNAIVKSVSRFQDTAIVVKVDLNKRLDPDKDGYPNTIDVFSIN